MAAIEREDLDAGRVDLADVVDRDAPPLPPVSPGEVLRAEFLEPLGLSAGALARAIGVPRNRLTGINGKRRVTADTALRWASISAPRPSSGCRSRRAMTSSAPAARLANVCAARSAHGRHDPA
jgi:addiction module HigA family antidote